MNCTTTKNGEIATLKFQEAMLVGEIAPAKNEIVSAINSADSIVLDLNEVKEFDTAGVQLLYCAAFSAVAVGKKVSVKGVSQELNDTVRRIGLSFSEIVECWEDAANA